MKEELLELQQNIETKAEIKIKELSDDNRRYSDKLNLLKNNISNMTRENDVANGKLVSLRESSEIRDAFADLLEIKLISYVDHNLILKEERSKLETSIETFQKNILSMTEKNNITVENMQQNHEALTSKLNQEKSNLEEVVRQEKLNLK